MIAALIRWSAKNLVLIFIAAVLATGADGPGIPDHLHQEAFRPFRRLGTDMNVEGSGTGLSVARGHQRALGGDVRLANSKGGGLQATVVLPRRLIKVTERAQPRQIAKQRQQV